MQLDKRAQHWRCVRLAQPAANPERTTSTGAAAPEACAPLSFVERAIRILARALSLLVPVHPAACETASQEMTPYWQEALGAGHGDVRTRTIHAEPSQDDRSDPGSGSGAAS